MNTQLSTLPCGTVQVKVCEDNICCTGWCNDLAAVSSIEQQLQQSVRRAAYIAFIENKATA